MTDATELADDLKRWAKSAHTRDLYAGATPLSETLQQAAARIAELKAEVARLLEAIADTPERSRIEEMEHQAERDTDRIHDLSDEVERLRGALSIYADVVEDYASDSELASDPAYDWLQNDRGVVARAALDKDSTS